MLRARPLQFHWSPFPDDSDGFSEVCSAAETAGIESVAVPGTIAEVIQRATEAARRTSTLKFRIHFMAADFENGRLSNAAAELGDRLIVHVTDAGALRNSIAPAIDVEGQSAEAAFLAIKHGNCLFRLPDRPEQVRADALPVLHFGKQVGLVMDAGLADIDAFIEYKTKGISQFLLRASSGASQLADFAARVLPRVRKLERNLVAAR